MIVLGFLKRATITDVLASHGYRGSGLTWIRVGENANVCAHPRLGAEWRVRIADVRERLSGARFG